MILSWIHWQRSYVYRPCYCVTHLQSWFWAISTVGWVFNDDATGRQPVTQGTRFLADTFPFFVYADHPLQFSKLSALAIEIQRAHHITDEIVIILKSLCWHLMTIHGYFGRFNHDLIIIFQQIWKVNNCVMCSVCATCCVFFSPRKLPAVRLSDYTMQRRGGR